MLEQKFSPCDACTSQSKRQDYVLGFSEENTSDQLLVPHKMTYKEFEQKYKIVMKAVQEKEKKEG